MVTQRIKYPVLPTCGLAFLLLVAGLALADAARGAEPVREATSLKFVPSGAAFYASLQRNREQWDVFVNSKAYARIAAMPSVQMAVGLIKAQWDDPSSAELGMFKAVLALPENKELLELLADAASHEIFFYGDSGYADFLELANRLNRLVNTAQFEALRSDEDPGAVMLWQVLELLDKQGDKLKLPDTLVGFKLSDAKRAEKQLARLETVLGEAFASRPDLKMRLKREKIAGADFLSLYLDGTLIPWDAIPRDAEIKDKAAFDKLVAKVKKMTLTISLGVRDGYLLLSLGATNQHLAVLGKGKLLVDRPEFAPLLAAGDKKFTSVGYVSDEFAKKAGSVEGQFDDLVMMARLALPESGLDEKLQKELIADAEALAADIKKLIPKPGMAMGFTYLTPRGYEGFAYNWAEHRGVDGSKPLTILDHVGGDPILFVAGREKSSPEEFQLISKWSQRALYYFEQIGLKELDAAQRETYAKLRKEAEPLVKRLAKATSDMLLPALQDGQGAFVLEAKSVSKQWHQAMPPATKPLPMLELALVVGVSDAELLKKAFAEYFAVTQEALDKLHKATPDEVPEIKLPAPKTKSAMSGTIYYYDLPEVAGLDKQLAPNAGLSKSIGVLSYSPAQTERLLATKPLPTVGPLARRNLPLAGASSFNFPALVDAISPWIDYGLELWVGLQANDLGEAGLVLQAEDGSVKAIKEQIAVVLDVLKCFRGGSSVSYFEGKALVTHYEWHFQDLK